MSRKPGRKSETGSRRMSRTRRFIRAAVFIGVQLLLLLALLEIGGRFFDPLGISYYPETARLMDTHLFEEPIGYRLRPGLEDRFHGERVRINLWGLREGEVAEARPEGEYRILVQGDSVPFGIGVSHEDSIPHQLEVMANRQSDGGVTYRTINMGVPSYNTDQELIQLQDLGWRFDPNLVVLWYSWNDVETKMWVYEKRHGWTAGVAQRSYAASLLFVLCQEIRAKLGPDRPRPIFKMYQSDHPRWIAVDRSLTEISRQCAARGVDFVVFTPAPPEPMVLTLLAGVGAREGFPVIELDPFSDPRWEEEDPDEYCNSVVDNHRNSAGCRIMATILHEELLREGVLQ